MFKQGQNSLEVAQAIVKANSQVKNVRLISHKVAVNWRQVHKDSKSKMSNIAEALDHPKPTREINFSREKFLEINLDSLEKLPDDEVWSLVSLVPCSDNMERHIPMMNFHPVDISSDEIKLAIKIILPNLDGAFLSSGRFFHYYGNGLLDKDEWFKFMTDFLMPCILVSPRYIGHRLSNGYCTLRLTADKTYKTKIPEVVDILQN